VLDKFRMWDKDGNGFISRSEFQQVLMSIGTSASDIPALFKLADANNDNEVNYKELVDWIYSDCLPRHTRERLHMHGALPPPERESSSCLIWSLLRRISEALAKRNVTQEEFFWHLDIDRSNTLSWVEFERLIRHFEPGISQSWLRDAFSEFDRDNNGQIDRAEFFSALQRAEATAKSTDPETRAAAPLAAAPLEPARSALQAHAIQGLPAWVGIPQVAPPPALAPVPPPPLPDGAQSPAVSAPLLRVTSELVEKAAQPDPASPIDEGIFKQLSDAIQAMGFDRTKRETVFKEFMTLREHRDATVRRGAFERHATRRWSLTRQAASGCFRAIAGGAVGVTRFQFLVAYAVMVAFDPEQHNALTEIVELRMRVVFCMFDPLGTWCLLGPQRRTLLRILAAGDGHISALEQALDWPTNESEPVPFHSFRTAALTGKFSSLNLRTREFFKARPNSGLDPAPDVVIDFRPVAAPATGRPPAAADIAVASEKVKATSLNDEFVLSPMLEAHGDWRGGLAAPHTSSRYRLASCVVETAFALARNTRYEDDIPDRDWMPNGSALEILLQTANKIEQDERFLVLASDCKRILQKESTLVRVPAPAKVFGDLHGQFRDLLLLLDAYGFPSHRGGDVESVAYIFNGDWVDRGAHQLEVVLLLFALKVIYPARIFLVRGNHEFRSQSVNMGVHGFLKHCQVRGVSDQVYQACHDTFDWLPLGALVEKSALVIHGGLGDGKWTLADLEKAVPRPLQNEFALRPFVGNVLWSDPSESDAFMARGVHASVRGNGILTFGPDVTADFCNREGIQLVIRSHQLVADGVKFMHRGHLVTVFSARNYCYDEQNDSALLLLARDADGNLRVRVKRLLQRDRDEV